MYTVLIIQEMVSLHWVTAFSFLKCKNGENCLCCFQAARDVDSGGHLSLLSAARLRSALSLAGGIACLMGLSGGQSLPPGMEAIQSGQSLSQAVLQQGADLSQAHMEHMHLPWTLNENTVASP